MKVDINRLKTLLDKNLSYEQLGREFGVSRQAIEYHCRTKNLVKSRIKTQPEVDCGLEIRRVSFALGRAYYSHAADKFRRKKQNCRNTGIEFHINFEEIEWPLVCPVLGIKLNYQSDSDFRSDNSLSFDRTDNTKGYIPGNVQIISWRANRIKNDGTAEEHRKIAAYLDDKLNSVIS